MTRSTYGTMYYVKNMAKSVAYFRKLLGLKPSYQSAEWTEFPIRGHRLCLHEREKGCTYVPNGVLILEAKGVKALYKKLKARKVKVFGLHEVHPKAWTFTLKDPSGNELSYYGAP